MIPSPSENVSFLLKTTSTLITTHVYVLKNTCWFFPSSQRIIRPSDLQPGRQRNKLKKSHIDNLICFVSSTSKRTSAPHFTLHIIQQTSELQLIQTDRVFSLLHIKK